MDDLNAAIKKLESRKRKIKTDGSWIQIFLKHRGNREISSLNNGVESIKRNRKRTCRKDIR